MIRYCVCGDMDFTHRWKFWTLFVAIVVRHVAAADAGLFMNSNALSSGESSAVKKGTIPLWDDMNCTIGESDGTKCQFSYCGQANLLINCTIGFAKGVIGGRLGDDYTVTKSDDNPDNPEPGTLRYGVTLAKSNPLGLQGIWILFAHDMNITLKKMLPVESHTTIDGRGAKVVISGYGLGLNRVENVIIHNIQISDSHQDTVHIFGSKKVWVDHLTSFRGKTGLVSAVRGSTDITISNCRLFDTNFNMLLGAQDSDETDKNMRVTVYKNWFKDSNQRNPHCRWGYCHVVNNLYTNWGLYAIGARAHARVYSERNVFVPGKTTEVTGWYPGYESKWDTSSKIESNGDKLMNGATFHEFVYTGSIDAPPYKRGTYPPLADTETLPRLVEHCSGALLEADIRTCRDS